MRRIRSIGRVYWLIALAILILWAILIPLLF